MHCFHKQYIREFKEPILEYIINYETHYNCWRGRKVLTVRYSKLAKRSNTFWELVYRFSFGICVDFSAVGIFQPWFLAKSYSLKTRVEFDYCYLFWQEINYDSPRGGVSVITEKGDVTTSYLLIQRAVAADSGKYTCSPSNANSKTVVVHVLNGRAKITLCCWGNGVIETDKG